MRPYYLSGAEIIYLSYFKSIIKRHFKMVISSFFISCRIWKIFAPLKRTHQRMVYSKWINRRNTPVEQILNSNDVEARETFTKILRETLTMTSRLMGFHDVTVKLPWRNARHIYGCSRKYETIDPSKQPILDSYNFICSMNLCMLYRLNICPGHFRLVFAGDLEHIV